MSMLVFRCLFFIIALFCFALNVMAVKNQNVVISIVQDGPSEILDKYTYSFKENMSQLAEDSFYTVNFIEYRSETWNDDEIKANLIKANEDLETDFIFLNGFIGAGYAAEKDFKLKKKVISSFVVKTDLIEFPTDRNGNSLKENFAFIKVKQSFEKEAEVFKESLGFNTLHVLTDAKFLKVFVDIEEKAMERNLSGDTYEIYPLEFKDSVEDLILEIDKTNIEAVYLTPLPRLSFEDRKFIIQELNKRKIPTFSGLGIEDLYMGALMTTSPDISDQVARKVALNIHQILILDKSTKDLSLYLPFNEKLSINAKTADDINYYPDFSTELGAELLYKDQIQDPDYSTREDLSLDKTMLLANQANIDLKISKYEVKELRESKNRSLTSLLPQASLDGDYTAIDDDRAGLSAGITPESSTTLGVSVSQMIFDDELITNFRRARKSFQGQEFNFILDSYDTIAAAGSRFLDYISQIELLKIEIENLKLVQENLDLAQNRFEVGNAGREEVFRWQSEKAQSKSSVISQEANLNSSLVALNQVMNEDQFKNWNILDFNDVDVFSYGPLQDRVSSNIKNRKDVEVLKRFLVEKAFVFSPELASFDKQIEAQQLRVNQLKRRFVLPKFFANFGYDRILQSERTGINADLQEDAQENQFTFSITGEYSLFEGGARIFDIKTEIAVLEQLKNQRERSRQFVELETLQAIYDLTESYPRIFLTREATENAKKNLEVISDKYSRGLIDIITLIDAQNEYFTQNLEAAIAKFDYLADMVNLQRAISWFQVINDDKAKQKLIAEFKEFKEEYIK